MDVSPIHRGADVLSTNMRARSNIPIAWYFAITQPACLTNELGLVSVCMLFLGSCYLTFYVSQQSNLNDL